MVGAPTGTVTLAQAKQGDYRAAGKPVLDTVRPAHDTGDHGSTLSGLAWFAAYSPCSVKRSQRWSAPRQECQHHASSFDEAQTIDYLSDHLGRLSQSQKPSGMSP
jgi:hypothetical protein